MNEIQVLDQNTIDKIAAGEVVERPSSVVKELAENAIDAGATAITVEIADGGKKLIRITDNGSGIPSSQVPLAFLRHATSKIRSVSDLYSIASLGFRGEALSSIAAVAQVELITRTSSAMSGTRYLISGGKEEKLEETGAPEGTTFLVRNLFFNTPARSKFLKSDTTEANYISALMEQLALSHPEISFKYIQNRQVRLHSSGNCNRKEVIYSIYGRDITKQLLEVSCETDFMKVTGFIGKPEIARGNRSFENYYINGRFVRDKIIAKAIEDGYKGFLMQHKFPFVSLEIEMDGNELDVNVHPSKMEVRFARGAEVYEAISRMIHDALSGKTLIPAVNAGKEERTVQPVLREKPAAFPEPFEALRRRENPENQKTWEDRGAVNYRDVLSQAENQLFAGRLADAASGHAASEAYTNPAESAGAKMQPAGSALPSNPAAPPAGSAEPAGAGANAGHASHTNPERSVKPSAPASPAMSASPAVSANPASSALPANPAEPAVPPSGAARDAGASGEPEQLSLFQEQFLDPRSRTRIHIIGQLFDTYWLAQFGDSLFIIDQHAAHEKVNYERFLKRYRERKMESQNLCPPIIVTLSMEEEAVLNANMERFTEAGFEIDHFGGREYSIHAVPADIYLASEDQLFHEMLDSLSSDGSSSAEEVFTGRLATMACKAAVKGNNRLSIKEAEALIDEMMTLENPYHCPHGRPTIIEMTKSEIERKFKRVV